MADAAPLPQPPFQRSGLIGQAISRLAERPFADDAAACYESGLPCLNFLLSRAGRPFPRLSPRGTGGCPLSRIPHAGGPALSARPTEAGYIGPV